MLRGMRFGGRLAVGLTMTVRMGEGMYAKMREVGVNLLLLVPFLLAAIR